MPISPPCSIINTQVVSLGGSNEQVRLLYHLYQNTGYVLNERRDGTVVDARQRVMRDT